MGRFASILENSAAKTDKDVASEISSLTRLKDDEIQTLFPTKPEKERLLKLFEIVGEATNENAKIKKLKDNFDDLAAVAIRFIGAVL